MIPLSSEMTITQWHVPIDDQRCYWYALFTSFTGPVDKTQMRDQRLQLYTLPDYMPRVGRFNNYGYDVDQQQRLPPTPAWAKTSTCTINGRWSRRARSRTARASIWERPTRRSSRIRSC